MSTQKQQQKQSAVEQISESDESYAGDIAMMTDCSAVATSTVLPHMEILQSQMEGQMAAEIAELSEAAQAATAASGAAITAITTENSEVAEAHNEQPEAHLDKAYYQDG